MPDQNPPQQDDLQEIDLTELAEAARRREREAERAEADRAQTETAPVADAITTEADAAERQLQQILNPSPTDATLILPAAAVAEPQFDASADPRRTQMQEARPVELLQPEEATPQEHRAPVGMSIVTVMPPPGTNGRPMTLMQQIPPQLGGVQSGSIAQEILPDADTPAPEAAEAAPELYEPPGQTPGLAGTVGPGRQNASERAGSRDVIRVADARIPPDLLEGINDAHAGFAAYRAAAEIEDEERMKAAVIQFETGLNKIEIHLEMRGIKENAPLHPDERIEILCRIILGKDLKAARGALADVFAELQSMRSPDDSIGDPLVLFQKQMGVLRKHIGCTDTICFSGPEFDAMMLGLLRIDWWGTRDAKLTVAGATVSAGRQAAQFRKLGAGAMAEVALVGEEIAAKYPVTEKEVAISARAGKAGCGPRTIAKMGQQIILLMIYEKNAVPMDEYLQSRLFDPALMTRLAQQMAKMHAEGIVHRDIKEGNVLMLEDGTPLVIDYGLSEIPDDGEGRDTDGMIRGTPTHMAPETLAGEYSMATDVYALGCIAFENATGRSWSNEVCRVTGKNSTSIWEVMMATNELQYEDELFEEALKLAEEKAGAKTRNVLRRLLHPKKDQRAKNAAEAAELLATLAA